VKSPSEHYRDVCQQRILFFYACQSSLKALQAAYAIIRTQVTRSHLNLPRFVASGRFRGTELRQYSIQHTKMGPSCDWLGS
jgi:hypothetical protein